MGDRDIPSVPVTTLAGLTSLSDLLSELPVSDSLTNVAPLNKSLLFHTLVANESHNLLSVRDDNLVRQLVTAIEQTNSDNIELKPQYATQQYGANISTYPELLQGIYNYRPTVFNTPQRTANPYQLQQQQMQHQQLHQHQQLQPQQQSYINSNDLQQQQRQIIQQINTHATEFGVDLLTTSPGSGSSTSSNFIQQAIQLPPQQQQHVVANKVPAVAATAASPAYVQQQLCTPQLMNTDNKQQLNLQTTVASAVETSPSSRRTRRAVQEQQQLNSAIASGQVQENMHANQLQPQQLQQQLLQQQPQQQQQSGLRPGTDPGEILAKDCQPPSWMRDTAPQRLQQQQQQQQQQQILQQSQQHQHSHNAATSQQTSVIQMQGSIPSLAQQPQQQQHQIPVQPQQSVIHTQQTTAVNAGAQLPQSVIIQQQQQQQQQQTRMQDTAPQRLQPQQQTRQMQNVQNQQNTQKQAQNQQQTIPIVNHLTSNQSHQIAQQQPHQLVTGTTTIPSSSAAVTTPPPAVQGNFQNVLNLQRQQILLMQQQQQQHQNMQKSTPRNNEFLQNQQPNKNPSNQSPAQAAIAPDDQNHTQTQLPTTSSSMPIATTLTTENLNVNSTMKAASSITSSSSLSGGGGGSGSGGSKSHVRVCINRLKAEDARLMQHSIKEFVQKSPELARKIGLPVSGAIAVTNINTTTTEAKLMKPDLTTKQEPATTTTAAAAATSTPNLGAAPSDAFTMMKADEKRSGLKRRMASVLVDLPPEQIYSKPKVRCVERITETPAPKSAREDIMRSQTYQQFMRNMEQIIELLDDTEPPNFESDDVDENVECISSKMLNTMSNDVAKLKAKGVLDTIPKNKLTLLINYAMRNVYLAKNYSAGPDDEDDIVDDDIMEKILNAIEACLLICNIYSTAKDLKFLQEDNIALIIKFVQFQLRETIFPSYDAVYTVKSMKKTNNRKKSRTQHNHNRNLQLLYSKAVELMKVFVTLFDKCIFVDTIVLPLSTVAIEPFFVDNIETLQFVCLELVTTIFRKERYDKIRSSILTDILTSIDRLPSSKKNLRPFKLTNNGGNIQMVTALVLQLIQCATILPDSLCEGEKNKKILSQQIIDLDDEIPGGATKIGKQQNNDVIVLKKYDVAISIGGNFLTTFLNKCKTRSNDTDFRPLFENFIHDLLATVNRPEWPASELLLSLLGTMLVRYVSDKSIEQSIRLVSLDYLGIVAARLRKDTVESRCKVNIIDSMIQSIKAEQEKEGDLPIVNSKVQLDPEEERTEFLQKILLDFLAVNAQEENLIWDYARHFYLTQWYRDIIYQRRRIAEGGKGYASRKKNKQRKKRRRGDSEDSSATESSNDDNEDNDDEGGNFSKNGNRDSGAIDQELNLEIFSILEERKKYLLGKIKPFGTANDIHIAAAQHIKTYIDYNNAHLIAQYLATKRPFSQSFDGYLKKIILVVNEQSIAVRTRAMKCLANIVEVDPMVLKRKDMQMGVNQKFLDTAISVREAAVDLIGKFVLSNEELIDQYYDMLSMRILDTGVSVRKRVIKILRDICIEYPDFVKIPEICVKMIRRVNDEEGIQKLVTEVFMKMWFTACAKNDKYGVQRKINQVIDVVNTAHDTGTSWLEGLLTSIFQPKENVKLDGTAQEPVKKNTEPPAEIVLACQQLADGLVDRLIELEDTDNARMLGCITTLHLLAKVRPQLLIRHAMTIEPYLNIKCHPSTAPKFICAVADILEKVVPLVNNASEYFLASLEEHLMLLVVSLNQAVVTSCVSCLGALVNKITKNYKLIRDCFQKFYRILDNSRIQVTQNNQTIEAIYNPLFRRSIFTIGILMRYFDFKSPQVIGDSNTAGGGGGGGLPPTICDDVFECLMFFIQCSNQEVRKQALIALGSFCVMNDDYLTRSELKRYYCDLMHSDTCDPSIKIICMRNIWIYLTESEMYMYNKEKEWEKESKTEDLKEMNDVSSGMASRIIQLYLQEVLDCFLNRDDNVRLWAVKVVQIVLRQGLVHPVRMVPYLIALSTDSKQESAHRADALLKDIDKTYTGFVNMKVQFGLQLCFKLQEILQCYNKGKNIGSGIIRGYTKKPNDAMPAAMNDFLYTLLRSTKPQRRALVHTVTKQFDDQKISLRQMLYIADNLAYFSYVVQDEPLYLIHQIDLLISTAGTNLLTTFKECLKPGENAADVLEDDDDEEDPAVLVKRLPEDTTEIQKCITSAQACMLLLILKEHLKEMYGLTDTKISRYSPSEPKVYEKAVTRKTVPDFQPKTTIEIIRKQQEQKLTDADGNAVQLNEEERTDLVMKYLDFKQLMLKLDPDDNDSDEEGGGGGADKSKLNSSGVSDATPTTTSNLQTTLDSSALSAADQSMNTANMLGFNMQYLTSPMVAAVTKETPLTPTSRASTKTNFAMPKTTSTARKQPQRSKRKKRKMISSDEDDDDYSDEEYA